MNAALPLFPESLMTASLASSSPAHRGFRPWVRRLWVLTGHTFTQLVRMKVFYFLLVFSLIMFVAGFVQSSITPDAELKLVKDTSFGVMQIFGALFGIVGMALLLPKDIEDRTLYTILSKPVRRYEYLLGKYFGVLAVLAVSLVIMHVMACGVLHVKYSVLVADEMQGLEEALAKGKLNAESFELAKEEALGKASLQGIRPDLHMAVVAIFLKAAVITAVAMAVSTFAGSTIFTLLATLSIYVIGHLQATARESFLAPPRQPHMQQVQAGEAAPPAPAGSVPLRLATGIVAVIFPDFQVYNVVDAVVEGKTLTWKAIGKMGALSALYLAIYLGAAIFLFAEKEL